MKQVKRLKLSIALIGSLVAGLAIAQPAMSATAATAQPAMSATPAAAGDCNRTITNADNLKTITLVAGTCATLSLNPAFAWATPVSSGSAVTVTDTETFAPDSIWTINAIRRGRATISSSGGLICEPGEVCPLILAVFSVHIRVVSPYGS